MKENTSTTTQPQASQPIQLVVPFDASRDDIRRLILLHDSYRINAQFDFRFVVVTNQELSLTFEHETITYIDDTEISLTGALLAAASCSRIDEEFILAPLDTYIMKPITRAHVDIPKIDSPDSVHLSKRFPMTYYKSRIKRLIDKIESSVATPTRASLEACFGLTMVRPMIFDWPKDFILLPVVSENPSLSQVLYYLAFKAAVYIKEQKAFESLHDTLNEMLIASAADKGLVASDDDTQDN